MECQIPELFHLPEYCGTICCAQMTAVLPQCLNEIRAANRLFGQEMQDTQAEEIE
jgi:hypothetical protein